MIFMYETINMCVCLCVNKNLKKLLVSEGCLHYFVRDYVF